MSCFENNLFGLSVVMQFLSVRETSTDGGVMLEVTTVDHSKLTALAAEMQVPTPVPTLEPEADVDLNRKRKGNIQIRIQ